MSRSEQRSQAFHLFVLVVSWFGCGLLWAAVLSFDPADWPSQSQWPAPSTPANWLGHPGAILAHLLFSYLGAGAYAAAFTLSAATVLRLEHVRPTEIWLRVLGVILTASATAALCTMYMQPSARWLVSGPGGSLGIALTQLLASRLPTPFALIVLFAMLLVGLMLAADQALLRIARWSAGVGTRSAPSIIKGSETLISATAMAASHMGRASAKLASAGVGWIAERTSSATPATASDGQSSKPTQLNLPLAKRLAAAATLGSTAPKAPPAQPTAEADRKVSPASAAFVETDLDEAADDDVAEPESPKATGPKPVETAGLNGSGLRITDLTRNPALPKPRPVDPLKRDTGTYILPPMTLLEDATPIDRQAIEMLCREKAYILEQTLGEFKLEVQVVAIETGPVITQFELKLAAGIKVSQIASLSNDIARSLKAPSVRVVAPLPGKNTIGIEVPNIDKEKVRIKDLIRCAPHAVDQYALPLFLGKDASGQALVADLTAMPHLLVAGTTGSGKSVCITSIILSFLLTRSPDEVNLILVDPKVVELTMFKDIPHLISPIITEMSKAESVLDWAATKMDERYALLAEAGVKDIRSYNRLGEKLLRERMQIETDDEFAKIPVKLPYIVIVVDELADLMMMSPKEVEFYLCRIAQKSRAVGIHLIVSTQRPQANVVTGLIKSNLPSRIAFRVSSRLDSRIVLDQNGGEVLMGQGDMLFLPPGSSKLVRAQGTFIADDELRSVVKHCHSQRQPTFNSELVRAPKSGEDSGERDELFDQAVDIIIESGRGSVSLLQRKLNIGYGRSSRLIDQMALAGIVGDYKGSQAREVVVTKEEWATLRGGRDAADAEGLS